MNNRWQTKRKKKRITTIANFALRCFIAVLAGLLCWAVFSTYHTFGMIIERVGLFPLGLAAGIGGALSVLYLCDVLFIIGKFVWYKARRKPSGFWELAK